MESESQRPSDPTDSAPTELQTKAPKFTVSEVFSARDPVRVEQVRFLIASQALAAIGRLLGELPSNAGVRESKTYLLVLSVGAANEAAAVFSEADAAGAFHEVVAAGWKEMKERIARLRDECDERNPTSLRRLLTLVTRNTLAFHWDSKLICRALRRVGAAELPVWAGGEDASIARTAYPVVEVVIHDALEAQVGSKETLQALMPRLAKFQGDLFHLAAGVYTRALRKAADDGRLGPA